MGNWNINIQGVGSHHNGKDSKIDANNMAAKFVRDLLAAGHTVQDAVFTHGGAEDLHPKVGSPVGVNTYLTNHES